MLFLTLCHLVKPATHQFQPHIRLAKEKAGQASICIDMDVAVSSQSERTYLAELLPTFTFFRYLEKK